MIQLTRGEDSLVLTPEYGGSIVGWTRRGIHIFRRPSPAAVLLGRQSAMGLFPLLPFCNRIAQCRFTWDRQTYELAANFGDSPHAIHGIGWQRAWQVETVSAAGATLSLHHDASSAWPFAFEAHLTYSLTARGLTLNIDATNLHPAIAPMGIGAHPWFPRAAEAAITFQAAGVWFTRDTLPVRHGAIPPAWDFANGRQVDREPLDHCFTGWSRVVRMPGVRIEADPVFGNLQVYTPSGKDFFCVEPVSHVPDAINRPDLPAMQAMTALAPGQTLSGSMTFIPDDGA
jgi:aldose 1-epimerase